MDNDSYNQEAVDELLGNNSHQKWQENPDKDIPKIERKGFYGDDDKQRIHKRSLDDNSSRIMQFVGVLRHMAVGVRKVGRYIELL